MKKKVRFSSKILRFVVASLALFLPKCTAVFNATDISWCIPCHADLWLLRCFPEYTISSVYSADFSS